ncbi:MAG TPA: extracellular solute-binding protein [Hypericibacter adhaerens]|uniref:Membrane protein n=1 Tax=Hypericibacter adhaerens TaxID=2602016 RepID=A0A5J6N0X5_9PROT|nr:extracellular solute-binding protein [Hypericibacter adhaerens]QEX22914.1 membrane protein [Hypericibacter adhaerens]HWA43158.1 extracellular solute-binding protein [Hypericibacter adhaerens]
MPAYEGLTWDHPRGYKALEAAAAGLSEAKDGLTIRWDRQPLEGFESHPIDDLCRRYDIVVLDHPHIGEAVAKRCLRPLETLFAPQEIAAWGRDTIGPCLTSYRYAGSHWALPLDAATQVMALRPDLLDRDPPRTWSEVVALPDKLPVCLSLAGPHAILSLMSISVSLGTAPGAGEPGRFLPPPAVSAALEILRPLAARSLPAARGLNPIGILCRMASGDDLALCPLVYGYVNYAAPRDPKARRVAFHDAPAATATGRPGSTLGGTGIAISRRCQATPALLDHLRWLMAPEAQTGFIPTHDGQPSRRESWQDVAVNAAWGDFYKNCFRTLELAWVRPRFDGYIAFQTQASAILRDGLAEGQGAAPIADRLQDCYAAHRPPDAEL